MTLLRVHRLDGTVDDIETDARVVYIPYRASEPTISRVEVIRDGRVIDRVDGPEVGPDVDGFRQFMVRLFPDEIYDRPWNLLADCHTLSQALVTVGLTKSLSSGRRLVQQRAVRVNGMTVMTDHYEPARGDHILVGRNEVRISA